MKKGLSIFIVLAFIILSINVVAEDTTESTTTAAKDATITVTGFDEKTAYSWLATESEKDGLSIQSLAISIIALNNKQQYNLDKQITALKDKGNLDSQCWPAGACNTIDTAYALLALKVIGEDVSKGLSWLNKSLVLDSQNNGRWSIVFDSKENGSCSIGLDGNYKPFTIQDNKINGKYVISLKEAGAITKSLQTVDFDCSSLPSTADLVVGLGYDKSETERFIVGSSIKSTTGSIIIPNACFPQKAGLGCDYDSTLFVSWAIAEMGEDVTKYGTYVYLETNNQKDMPILKTAFLTRFLEASALSGSSLVTNYYVDLLTTLQKSDGSFGDVYPTSVSVFALKPTDKTDAVAKGKTLLQNKWKSAGYWTTNLADNAWALIALSDESAFVSGYNSVISSNGSTSNIETECSDELDNDLNGLVDCEDPACVSTEYCLTCMNNIQDPGEEDIDCGGICHICSINNPIENNTTNPECYSDIDCGDNKKCDNGVCIISTTTAECMANTDCGEGKSCVSGKCIILPKEETGSSMWVLWIIILIIVLGGGGAYFYIFWIKTGKFKFKKKSIGPNFDEYRKQRESVLTSRPEMPKSEPKEEIKEKPRAKDDELEQALRKAEKILHGK